MEQEVVALVEHALAGRLPSAEELLPLFELETFSAEAAHVKWGADCLARRASGGRGQVYAQIGVDMLPCPMNCAFCTLAADNAFFDARGVDPEELIVPLEQVVSYARTFDAAGVHLVSLMATDALPFERYLEMVTAVRAAVADDLVLMANVGDVSLEQARQLKRAGVQMAYHAHRLGEGEITGIPGATRVATMHHLKEAGLTLMSAVEPVREGVPATLILERMQEVAGFKPYCAGVGTLTAVPGTRMGDVKPLSRARTALYASLFRLLVGEAVPYGTGGRNVLWVDAGTNPRGRDLPTNEEYLRRDVQRCIKELRGQEWEVPARSA